MLNHIKGTLRSAEEDLSETHVRHPSSSIRPSDIYLVTQLINLTRKIFAVPFAGQVNQKCSKDCIEETERNLKARFLSTENPAQQY